MQIDRFAGEQRSVRAPQVFRGIDDLIVETSMFPVELIHAPRWDTRLLQCPHRRRVCTAQLLGKRVSGCRELLQGSW